MVVRASSESERGVIGEDATRVSDDMHCVDHVSLNLLGLCSALGLEGRLEVLEHCQLETQTLLACSSSLIRKSLEVGLLSFSHGLDFLCGLQKGKVTSLHL